MKTKISIYLLFFGFLSVIVSCKIEPKKIDYGNDHCAFCEMTVVDKTHSAEYVTKKGKAYVFDSVECLVNDIQKENNEDQLEIMLVADYANPGDLTNAKTATYLISKNIKSPMGANLSAFSSQETAKKFQKENGGNLFSWIQLKEEFSK